MATSVLANSRKANSFSTSDTSNAVKGTSASKRRVMEIREKHTSKATSPSPQSSPLQQSTYLSSAYETLVDFPEDELSYAPIHDLVETYHILNTRIRAVAPALLGSHEKTPALQTLQADSRLLTRAIRRDVQLALINPFRSSSLALSEYHVQRSRDLGTLCQACLCLVSSMFALPNLPRLFRDQDLGLIFEDVLDIALAESLTLPSPSKIRSLASWVIRTQALPSAIISHHAIKLTRVVRKGLEGQGDLQTMLDTLKAIQVLSLSHATGLAAPLAEFLPQILVHISAEDAMLRLHAAHALGGFAACKLKLPPDFPHDTIQQHILKFIEHHSAKEGINEGDRRMPQIITDSFASRDRLRIAWCLVVVACIIVLLEDTIFTHPKSLRLCAVVFDGALKYRSRTIDKLHMHVWRAFVWSFSRLLAKTEDEPKMRAKVDKVLGFVAEELKDGIGESLVAVLLSQAPGLGASQPSSFVAAALKIVGRMIAGDKKAEPRDGLLLLHRLTSGLGSPAVVSSPIAGIGRPASGLFDGKVLEVSKEVLSRCVLSLTGVDMAHVRVLSLEEMKMFWEELVSHWAAYAETVLQKADAEFPTEMFDVWQSLLLSQAELDLAQGPSHLVASTEVTSQIAATLVQLFSQLGDTEDQKRRIGLVHRLFGIATAVYAPSWAPGPAQVVLANLLEQPFDLTDHGVKDAWARLCHQLVATRIPSLLHVISSYNLGKGNILAQRQLWIATAEHWSKPEGPSTLEELVTLLQVPVLAWKMTRAEVKVWTTTLKHATSLARTKRIREFVVVQGLVEAIGSDQLVGQPSVVSALLDSIKPSDFTTMPEDIVVVVDRTLRAQYPPKPEDLPACLSILQRVGELITTASSPVTIQCLGALKESLHVWIVDEEKAMLGSEYDHIIRTLYRNILAALRPCTPSVEALLAISPFLVTVFSASDPSGSTAFQDFWRATYHNIERYRQYYPPDLKAILLGLTDVYGGSLADGLSLGSESQATAMTTILDSQSPPLRAVGDVSDVLPQSLMGAALLASAEHHTPRREATPSEASTKRRHDNAFQPDLEEHVASQDILSPQDEDTQTRKRRRVSSWIHTTSFIGPSPPILLSPPLVLSLQTPDDIADPQLREEEMSFQVDYDSWEIGMSSQEIEQIRKDLAP